MVIKNQSAQPKRSRTLARVAAIQALYQCEQADAAAETVVEEFRHHRFAIDDEACFEHGGIPNVDQALFRKIVLGTNRSRERVDEALKSALPASWPIERLDPVLRALLRAGVWELGEQKPAGIVINEYLNVAHGFLSLDEVRMVNGILDTVNKGQTSAAG